MTQTRTDTMFAGSIPELYEKLLVPLIFEPYAVDLAERLAARPSLSRVLEVAAGTGVVTRRMAALLPERVAIVATDLNQPMLDHAQAVGTARAVTWQQADAQQLPFADASFDAVVCQFGVMFFPDQAKAFAEAHRVLAPGGVFLFNVWDRIEENEVPEIVTRSLRALFPNDPPRFLARVPHGHHDLGPIVAALRQGGFAVAPRAQTVPARSRAGSARLAGMAFCLGTPLRSEIETRDRSLLDRAVEVATEALEARFGAGPVDGKIQAHVVAVDR